MDERIKRAITMLADFRQGEGIRSADDLADALEGVLRNMADFDGDVANLVNEYLPEFSG